MVLNIHGERVRATENAPRDPFYLLERRHGLAEIGERGTGVRVERRRETQSHPPSAGRRLRFRRLWMKTGLELI